jgi:hypothetical protein
MRRIALTVVLSCPLALLAAAAAADPCPPVRCVPDRFLPAAVDPAAGLARVPVNAQRFAFKAGTGLAAASVPDAAAPDGGSTLDTAASAQRLPELVLENGPFGLSLPVATHVEGVRAGFTVLAPDTPLALGSIVRVSLADACGTPSAELVQRFEVVASAALPSSLGTLSATLGSGLVAWSSEPGVCAYDPDDQSADLVLAPADDARAYLDLMRFELETDEGVTLPSYQEAPEQAPDVHSVLGAGRDRVAVPCAYPSAGALSYIAAVRMRGVLPDGTVVPSELVAVGLTRSGSCWEGPPPGSQVCPGPYPGCAALHGSTDAGRADAGWQYCGGYYPATDAGARWADGAAPPSIELGTGAPGCTLGRGAPSWLGLSLLASLASLWMRRARRHSRRW